MLSPNINVRRPSKDSSVLETEAKTSPRNVVDPSGARLAASAAGSRVGSRRPSNLDYSPKGTLHGSNLQLPLLQYIRDGHIRLPWPEKSIDGVPEIELMMKTTKPGIFGSKHSYVNKLLSCLGAVCRNKVNDSCGLDNFKPVVNRTNNNLEYVGDIQRTYALIAKYGPSSSVSMTSMMTNASVASSKPYRNDKNKPNQPNKPAADGRESSPKSKSSKKPPPKKTNHSYLKDFYEKAYRTLQICQSCTGHFKSIIYALTFSRYMEEELTESEIKLTRGKSIIGSCMWVVVYALQQLQEDPEIAPLESVPKPHSGLHELAVDMQNLIVLSFQTWHELVIAVTILERMHRKTEDIFHRQTSHFTTVAPADSEIANVASLHLQTYRRADGDIQELKNLKTFDPYATLMVWNRRSGPSRILYKTDYANQDSLWNGFDPLTVDKKVNHLKDIVNFVRLILEGVREAAQKITNELQGRTKDTLSVYTRPTSAGIITYEDGIDSMEESLMKRLLEVDWEPAEIHEFFEVDKIFLDSMDLLTLGAGVTRAILHEARHMVHICYETSRLLDFKEFVTMPGYERIYHRMKEEFMEANQKMKKVRRFSTTNAYDIEEIHMELRNVAGLFRTSAYHEILKVLPVYTNRVGLTLQDSELVFTPSSEKLLS